MRIFILLNLLIGFVKCVDEAFFNSARSGDIKLLKEYIADGVSVNARDPKGNSAIVIAAGRGHVNVINTLLDHGASTEDLTQLGLFEGKTALCWAASQGRTQAVAALLKAGADPNKIPDRGVFEGKTALMWAASQGRTQVVRLLLSANVDVNYSAKSGNFKGKSSLMWASSQGRVDTVITLLQAGSDVNAVDSDGVNALMWASGSEAADEAHKKGLQFLEKATKGQKDVVQALLHYGAELDGRDKDGITAIMYACYHGHTGAVEVLLNWGADAGVRNLQGYTALQLALNSGFEETARLILNGPTLITLPVPEMSKISTCGWLLSVVRGPRGTGIYIDYNTVSSNSGNNNNNSSSTSSLSSTANSGSGSSNNNNNQKKNNHQSSKTININTNTAHTDTSQNSCLTSQSSTTAATTSPNYHHTVATTCTSLVPQGLYYTSLGELLEYVGEVGVDETVRHLIGLNNFASVTKAKIQLKELYLKYNEFLKRQ